MWGASPYYMVECYEYDYHNGYDAYYEAGDSSADWQTTPRCWNGPACVFFARGTCQYYHPPEDLEQVAVERAAAPRTKPLVSQQQTSKPWNQLVVNQVAAETTDLADETTESRESISPQDDTPPPPRQERTPKGKRRKTDSDTRDRSDVAVASMPRRDSQKKKSTIEIPEDGHMQ